MTENRYYAALMRQEESRNPEIFLAMRASQPDIKRSLPITLGSQGGGGGSQIPPSYGVGREWPEEPNMIERVARLETNMDHLVKQVDRIDARTEPMPADIAVIKATMATKWWILGAGVAGLSAVGTLITFGEKLQALVR